MVGSSTCSWEGHDVAMQEHNFCMVCQAGILMCVDCGNEEAAYNDEVCKKCRADRTAVDIEEEEFMLERLG